MGSSCSSLRSPRARPEMSSARRLLIIACSPVAVFVAGLWISAQVQRHPFLFHPPADTSHAFSWDTTPEIVRRGNCVPGPVDRDPTAAASALRPEWRPQPGRYLLTVLVSDDSALWRKTRGRLWLHQPDSLSSRYLFYGATDLDVARAVASPHVASGLAPRPASTDATSPGVVVLRDSAARSISLILGGGALPPSTAGPWHESVVELRLIGGVGDGFWGWWRAGDSTGHRTGFFCAGWIEV